MRVSLSPAVRRSLLLTCALAASGALLGGRAGAQGTVVQPGGVAAGAVPPGVVTVQAGDTAYSLARRAGITVERLLQLNGLSSPTLKVGQVLRVQDYLTHQVQSGETLYAIAKRYGVTVDAVLSENQLPAGAVIGVGQRLKLPAGATWPGTAAGVPPGTAPQVSGLAAAGSGSGGPVTVSPQGSSPSVGGAGGSVAVVVPVPPAVGVAGSPFLPTAPTPLTPVLGHPDQLPSPSVPNAAVPSPALNTGGPAHAAAISAAVPSGWSWKDAALSLLGTPYVYGGTSRSGTDCSGLVLQVFTPLGFRLPRVSADQALVGQAVPGAELQPGDLVFFDTEGRGRVTHVGIYLGDDQFVNANSYQGKVVIDRLMTDRYWGPRFLGARRIMGTPLAQLP